MRALVLVSLILTSFPAFAFKEGACRQDAERLCPGKTGKEVVPCLKEHQADLSTDCKVNLAETRENIREAHDACKEDKEKFCADIQPGKGRILKCLHSHDAELSSTCQEQLKKLHQKMGGPPDSGEQHK